MNMKHAIPIVPAVLALLLAAPAAAPAIPAFPAATAEAAAADDVSWYWLSSDEKYSNFIDRSSIIATGTVETAHGRVATEIEAYIKTGYSYGGALETIKSYGLTDIIPNPAQLSYSVARLKVNPQNRTVQYAKEDFYDAQDHVLWSHTDGKEKEINSQSFDEPFYTTIVDAVFGAGEEERRTAKDRWLDLYTNEVDGLTTSAMADTTTMRMKGDNLLYWEWDTVKDVASGNTLEIKFMKKAVNLKQDTESIVNASYWSGQTGWQPLEDDLEGGYRYIAPDKPQHRGIVVLKSYAQENKDWVERYSIN